MLKRGCLSQQEHQEQEAEYVLPVLPCGRQKLFIHKTLWGGAFILDQTHAVQKHLKIKRLKK